MSILITDVLLNNKTTNIYIEDNVFSEIGGPKVEAEHVLNGKNKAAIPGLINTHTHAAMTLLRSYADDYTLQDWLTNNIWPIEAKLTKDDIYWGTKLACLEMITSGTTCFNDMYFHGEVAAKAVDEMGIRGVLSEVFFDLFDETKGKKGRKKVETGVAALKEYKNGRIIPALGPHALYTVSGDGLSWVAEFAEKNDLLIHFHLAETEKEIEDFIEKHKKRPIAFLDELGFLGKNLVAAHCVWLNKTDITAMAAQGVKISHNPQSNMKLSVGNMLHYRDLKESGCTVSLGTDGCASNNNLDMFETMKFAALGQKLFSDDPTIMPATESFEMATKSGARALGINTGEIMEGLLADILLLDLKKPCFTPNHNLTANIVYSANGSCVDTTICDGRILMEGGVVEGEEAIMEKAGTVAADLVARNPEN
jgi:5-methylthioadenosine/S-adenosylhomocysteine deaminase